MSKKYLTREATAEEARSEKPLREPNPSPLPSPMPPLPPTVPPVTGGGPMIATPKIAPAIRRLNAAFERMDKALKAYREAALLADTAIRGVSFVVLDEGGTKTTVRFRRNVK